MNIQDYLICINITILLFVGATIFNIYKEKEPLCESCILYNVKAKHGVGGVYYQDKYYCVWTKDVDFETIMHRDPNLNKVQIAAIHEIAHDMIYKQKEHFCKNICD